MKLNAVVEMIPYLARTWWNSSVCTSYQELKMFDDLEKMLSEITGFWYTLQPNAGAQGEYAVYQRKFRLEKGDKEKCLLICSL